MFVGKVQPYHYVRNMEITAMRSTALSALKQMSLPRYDRVEIGAYSQKNSYAGIYSSNSNQMKALGYSPCAQVSPDSRLQRELLPPSEQAAYTEEDALIHQYMKQSRIEGYFDGDTFVQTSADPVKLILKDSIAKEDLEKFQSGLMEQGLGTEIDWRGVQDDLVQIGVGFDNAERFEQKADYLASRYAVLQDRIQNQFAGDKQEAELQRLEQIFTEAKEEMANSYADSIGRFYEGLGQSGAADDMRSSVLALIDQKAAAYADSIEKTGIYESITDPDKQWLKQDDAYMAARLRESAALAEPQKQSPNEQIPYNGNDLTFAGIYAKTLSQQLANPNWNVNESDAALGRRLALQFNEWKSGAERAGISEKLSQMLTASFNPFMDRLMDSLDTLIDGNREWTAEKPWMSSMIRTEHIDRESVYHSFQKFGGGQ